MKRLFGSRPEDPEIAESDAEAGPIGADYDSLRAAFTAAVSHELRTPLARLLVLLESAHLPEADVESLIEQARGEVEQMTELVDDILFLSELETQPDGGSPERTRALPILREVLDSLQERAALAGVTLVAAGDEDVDLPLSPRMLWTVAENLAENAIRYAGPGSTFEVSARRESDHIVLAGSDDGAGVNEADLARLFERFYRADRARASRGSGLGLAIVKHVVGAAGGTVEAAGARGRGLSVRCAFPA